jgi:quercetin dioxygenase-like cupin family protein
MSEQSGHHYLKSHQISGEVLQLDLSQEQLDLLEAAGKAGTGTTAKTLVKDGPLRVVLIGLKEGASMREHKAEGPVTIQALRGVAQVSSRGETEDLDVGSMLMFGSGVTHSVEAKSDSVLLLTIAMDGATGG